MRRWQIWFLGSALVARLVAAGLGPTYQDAGNGLSRMELRIPTGPWSVQVVRMERSRTNLVLMPTLGSGDRIGLDTLSAQVGRIPKDLGEPLAAINGDFYQTEDESMPGDPRGLFIRRGELISVPAARDCFWLDREGKPRIGMVKSGLQLTWPDGEITPLGLNEDPGDLDAVLFTPAAGRAADEFRGTRLILERAGEGPWLPLRADTAYTARVARATDATATNLVLRVASHLRPQATRLKAGGKVRISTRMTPGMAGVTTALGGGPALVRGGLALTPRASKSNEQHPRSALGWNAQHFFLVTVDGRQSGFSEGMTLSELARQMAQLGCEEAMNLDGGGSTELWLRGRILNRPCYGHERRTASGLVVLRLPGKP